MKKIILATSSIHRKKAFAMLNFDFITRGSDVDEYTIERPAFPDALVTYLAQLKAEAVMKHFTNGIVIGFDSVGWFEGKVLEKPHSREIAFHRLKLLSGKRHEFYTGIYMIDIMSNSIISRCVKTIVVMRTPTDTEIQKYLDEDNQFTTYACGYDPYGHYSSTFVKEIHGSYNNLLWGLPLEVVIGMLNEVGHQVIN